MLLIIILCLSASLVVFAPAAFLLNRQSDVVSTDLCHPKCSCKGSLKG